MIRYRNSPCIIEVKNGENKKSKLLNTVLSTEKYGVKQAIRFSRNNVGESDYILSLPLYMVMFLEVDSSSPVTLPTADEIRKHIPD